MKKLRCTSCGGELLVEDNNEYAICNYCGARYKLNENMNINFKIDDDIKDGFKKASKTAVGVFVLIFAFMIITSIAIFLTADRKVKGPLIKEIDSFDVEQFNLYYNNASGTKATIFVNSTIDNIIRNNKTNDRKISLVYNEYDTILESDMLDIKHSLDEWGKYEVIVDYDNDGYVNKITLKDIK